MTSSDENPVADMRKSGVRIIYDIENLGIIGLGGSHQAPAALLQLRSSRRRSHAAEKPDVLVCVDYPGFNMTPYVAKELGILSSTISRHHLGVEQGTGEEYRPRCRAGGVHISFWKRTHTGRRERM